MSVRATERLIGDIVCVSKLPKGPLMVVNSINEEKKTVSTSWFSDANEYQHGTFPASSLDRAEFPAPKAKAKPKSHKK